MRSSISSSSSAAAEEAEAAAEEQNVDEAEAEAAEAAAIAQDLAQERYKYMDAASDDEEEADADAPVDPPFRGDPEFQALRCDLHKELQEMRVKFSPPVVTARLAELEQRQLTPEWVDAALLYKQRALRKNRKKYEAELRTRTRLPQPDDANANANANINATADERAVHHERQQLLQLLKVLHRRQLAVLRGYKVSTRPQFMRVKC